MPVTPTDDPEYYATVATVDHALDCLRDHATQYADQPFFQYIAFIAPHFPLHARPQEIAKYRDRYLSGWDRLRQSGTNANCGWAWCPRRCRRWKSSGTALSLSRSPSETRSRRGQSAAALGPVDRSPPPFQATKMAIHAAMVDCMDQQIGRLIAQLESMGQLDNTLIMFASDNGASAEIMVRDGGHDPQADPGSAASYLCLGPGFSSACNTPFRRHKTWVHEGGISTPLIVHWPAGITARNQLRRTPGHVIDFVPTVFEIVGIEPPGQWQDQPLPPLPGKSLLPALEQDVVIDRPCLWWLHEGHRAIRVGDWKLVAAANEPWQLFDLHQDRAEQHDLAADMPDKVAELAALWQQHTDQFTQLVQQ